MKESFAKKILHNKYIVAGIAAAMVIVFAAVFTAYGCVLINSDSILDGVSVGSVDLSGASHEEAAQLIEQSLQPDENREILFECEGTQFALTPAQIELAADTETLARQAYDVGRSGNVFVRIWEAYRALFAGVEFAPGYVLSDSKLAAAIQDNLADRVVSVTPYSVEIEPDALVVRNGTDGRGVAEQDIAQKIFTLLAEGTTDSVIRLTISTIPAEPIGFDEFCSEYIRDAQDATYTMQDGQYVFTPEVEGISFDKEQARAIIEENISNTQPYRIPAQITTPEVTVAELQSKFAVDVLGTYTTNYSSSDANRAANVALAAAKINGVVLNPGERFSFNGIVGPRTAAAGFKVAHVYEGDRVVDGLGGGICQVSSTLYNAVLLADLKIVYRTNHSMPVAYVPGGRDATVSYGTIDFVFENNKKHPVTVAASTYNRNLTISIKGVDESDGTTIEIVSENAGYTAYTTKETVDESLAPGEKKVVKNGSNGSIYNTYKIYKKDGAVIKREHIARSNYIPVARVVAVGPAKTEEAPSEPVVEPTEPEEPAEPTEQPPEQEEAPQPPQDEQAPQPGDSQQQLPPEAETDAEADVPASAEPHPPADGTEPGDTELQSQEPPVTDAADSAAQTEVSSTEQSESQQPEVGQEQEASATN